jgi:hypothetical protein
MFGDSIEMANYFAGVNIGPILESLVLRAFDTSGILKTSTTAIAAPIRQYSIDVAPLSSTRNFFISTLSEHRGLKKYTQTYS